MKFKDLLSSTCQISSKRRVLDLKSEDQGFNIHGGSICYWNILFSRSKASDANIGIIVKNSIERSINLPVVPPKCEDPLLILFCIIFELYSGWDFDHVAFIVDFELFFAWDLLFFFRWGKKEIWETSIEFYFLRNLCESTNDNIIHTRNICLSK